MATTIEVLLQAPPPETLTGGETKTATESAPPKRKRRPSVRLGEIGTTPRKSFGEYGRTGIPRRPPAKRLRSDWGGRVWESEVEVEKEGVRSWLVDLGLSRYAPVFEVHEVDQEVLPMLTLEDLRDMGINAVGSRRKLYSAIQNLANPFS